VGDSADIIGEYLFRYLELKSWLKVKSETWSGRPSLTLYWVEVQVSWKQEKVRIKPSKERSYNLQDNGFSLGTSFPPTTISNPSVYYPWTVDSHFKLVDQKAAEREVYDHAKKIIFEVETFRPPKKS
jgi:hypothetical protein